MFGEVGIANESTKNHTNKCADVQVHYSPIKTTINYSSEWTSILALVTTEKFQHPTGPTVPIPCSLVETYILLTRELLQYIVEQTNLYAEQCMCSDKFASWSKVSMEEMNAFLGPGSASSSLRILEHYHSEKVLVTTNSVIAFNQSTTYTEK